MAGMTSGERYTYLSGVVEGLAYARFAKDGNKETTGMLCLYSWFYDDPGAVDLIYAAVDKYPDYTAGVIIAALTKKKCG